MRHEESRSPHDRLLCALTKRNARLIADEAGAFRLARNGRGTSKVGAALVQTLKLRALIAEGKDGLVLSGLGRRTARQILSQEQAQRAYRRSTSEIREGVDGIPIRATVNPDESPLASLRRRTGPDGRPLIDAVGFTAGERLRADYTRGCLMPRVTANWDSAVADRRRDAAGGIAELTDAAMAARRRVERALAAAGPELAGVLIDVCCFLKGLEEVERERRWPARSAKVVLKVGLSALARHYGLTSQTLGAASTHAIVHWGTADYRPTID